MDKLNIAINGFGRIGRTFFRAAMEKGLDIVAINDLASSEQLAYLLKYDSAYGVFNGEILTKDKSLLIDGKTIPITNIKDPEKLPWGDLKIDIVVEATGVFRTKKEAGKHISAGAKNVIITAPAKGEEEVKTIVHGVNSNDFIKSEDKVISFASCTTNCIAPVVKILNENIGIEKSFVTTIHSLTSSQLIQDGPSEKDFRRGRAAGYNIVPTTTGANKATQLVYPKIEDRLGAMAFRVPSLTVSIIDMVAMLKRDTSIAEINDLFKAAAKSKINKDVIGVTEEPLVSSDLKGAPHGATVDLNLTQVLDKDLVKVVAWYDNELGYSNRLASFIKDIN
jgi:glyceraldehyde 3-phosphate dehydrogenase